MALSTRGTKATEDADTQELRTPLSPLRWVGGWAPMGIGAWERVSSSGGADGDGARMSQGLPAVPSRAHIQMKSLESAVLHVPAPPGGLSRCHCRSLLPFSVPRFCSDKLPLSFPDGYLAFLTHMCPFS